ncbi:unnamed protein product [marine sediment metagenome]|uniref:Uncharacterized protein n=1 Tax=marine sediment metagenome TaxID=412755 RepID=X1BSU7_9ZZZZ
MEKSKYDKTIELIQEISEGLMMTSQEVEDFIAVHQLEHKVEDALTVVRDLRRSGQPGAATVERQIEEPQTVLRDLRHKIMEGSDQRFEAMDKAGLLEEVVGGNPGNPVPEKCEFTKEEVKPKEHFDPLSFRTICPECPDGRCANCPPGLACVTRIITGCKEGEFVAGRCQIGTEAHTIYHGKP